MIVDSDCDALRSIADQTNVYNSINFGAGADKGAANAAPRQLMLPVYQCPSDAQKPIQGATQSIITT